MQFDVVQSSVEGAVATLTIDRPSVNALDSAGYGELDERLYQLSRDQSVRAVVLTAAGERFFGAGSDVKEFAALNDVTGPLYSQRTISVRARLYQFPLPVICAINGSAYGGSLGLAVCADIRLSVPEARFNLGEINMGTLGLTQHLSARCHNGSVRRMVYTGEAIDAQTAQAIGLIDEILPRAELLPRAYELARTIADKAPTAIRYAKECLIEAEKSALAGAQFEAERIYRLWGTQDKTEAVNAFLEKRRPQFKDR